MATDELILARSLGRFADARQLRTPAAARDSLPAVPRPGGGARDRVRVPRPRALGPDRVHLCLVVRGGGCGRLRGPAGRGGPPVLGADERRGGAHPGHPGRRERVGALRGRGPPVPACAVRGSGVAPGTHDGDDGEGCAGATDAPPRPLSGLVDQRRLLRLDRARRRPPRLGPAGGGARRRSMRPDRRRDEAALVRAREELFIAEGSDWFWWYGDDHSSEHDLEFDDLFRRHLRNVYRASTSRYTGRAVRHQHHDRAAADGGGAALGVRPRRRSTAR